MGYRLVRIFLTDYCTGREPGPEWLTLLRLCDDAHNDTAVSAIGWDELAGGRGRSTVARHLVTLREQGWISVVSRAAPGRRVRYRVLPGHYDPETQQRVSPVRPVDQSDGSHETARRVSRNGPTGLTQGETRSGSSGGAVRRHPEVAGTGPVAGGSGAALEGQKNGRTGYRPAPEDQKVKSGTEGEDEDPWGSDEDCPQSSGEEDPRVDADGYMLPGPDPWADWQPGPPS